MKKILLTISIALIFSCQQDNQISGTWLGPYRSSPFQVTAIINDPFLVTFQNGDYTARGMYNSDDTGNYKFRGDKITYNNKKEIAFEVGPKNDSFAFKGTKKDTFPIIYRRIPDSLKQQNLDNYSFSGKKYLLRINEVSDTLFFENDSLLTKWSLGSMYYKRVKLNGFDLILTSSLRGPPLILKEKIENRIEAYLYPKNLVEIVLIEL